MKLEGLEKMSTRKLVDLFCMTTDCRDENIPTVRGWLMDEIERRNPDGFERWLDGEAKDEELGKYVLE